METTSVNEARLVCAEDSGQRTLKMNMTPEINIGHSEGGHVGTLLLNW